MDAALVVQVRIASDAELGTFVVGSDLSGTDIVRVGIESTACVADLLPLLASRLGVCQRRLRAVLPDGRGLESCDVRRSVVELLQM